MFFYSGKYNDYIHPYCWDDLGLMENCGLMAITLQMLADVQRQDLSLRLDVNICSTHGYPEWKKEIQKYNGSSDKFSRHCR